MTNPLDFETGSAGNGLGVGADPGVPLPRRGLLERDWSKALVLLLTLLASVAVLWVVWQVVSPILHTLVLFALAAVLAFALSGPVEMLTRRTGNRFIAIGAMYLLVGVVVIGGLTLIAGPFVRQASDLAAALPQYPTTCRPARLRSRPRSANSAFRRISTNSRPRPPPRWNRAQPTCSKTWWARWLKLAESSSILSWRW